MIVEFLRLRFPLIILFAFLLKKDLVTAQIVNDSGTVTIMKGSSVVSTGNFTNAAGAIVNNGRLDVQGNFDNKDKYVSTTASDTLLLTGTRSATLNSGSATINSLQVNKTNGGGVALTANATIASNFNLRSGTFSTDPDKGYELIAPAAAAFTFGTGAQITGKVRRTKWINDSAIVFHQPGMTIKTSGGSAPASLLVNMIPGKEPTASFNSVTRYFYFDPAGGNNYTADVTFPYSPLELNTNNEANLAAWYYDPLQKWSQKLLGNTSHPDLHYVTSAGIKSAILAGREWKLAEMDYTNISSDLFVYPIPAKSFLNVYLGAERDQKAIIELWDASGKMCRLLNRDLQKGLNKVSINITGLSSGQYVLKVAEDKMVKTKVILISK